MSSYQLITLLTDFGFNDIYVGVMKGVIAQINPTLTVIDLTHEIPPQNIAAAQFNLMSAYPYFPPGTVHIVVVDPGVGGERRSIAIEFSDGFLIGPDNGVFTGILSRRPIVQVVSLSNTNYWRISNPSYTFHGRDIFAPAAAHLASGVPLKELGDIIDPSSLIHLPIPFFTPTPTGFAGTVQHIDRFGNIITSIPGDCVEGKTWSIPIGKRAIPGCRTYNDVKRGNPLALIGSHGWVEIAVNSGDAHFQLRLNWGDPVKVEVRE
ncbi:MAG: SAM-dependent chlorinase/fluorinase [Cyanobacteria bacterium CRU_2_1]|nr:SAM-dependent chlorinase/fluorinase [Cyanobacteria bacterium RU_5_0]NJR57694.1 SAM-dependent chlorinase/fluorinase [Cyanobacteria bacterium CRU_2_1]